VNPTNTSIFDISPLDKLRLVEDLWNDLAATQRGGGACLAPRQAFVRL
jgi:hypothetical protein